MITKIRTNQLDGQPPNTDAIMFNDIAGIQLRADVTPPFKTFGVTVKPRGPVQTVFYTALCDVVYGLEQFSGKKLKAIVTPSVWRAKKPNETVNRHAEGIAIDIGSVWWEDDIHVTAFGFQDNPRVYLGCWAVFWMHMAMALGHLQKAHENHWHLQLLSQGRRIGAVSKFELSGDVQMKVIFIQLVLRHLYGVTLHVDGQWGTKETEPAVNRILEQLECDQPDILEPGQWLKFLEAAAFTGFGRVEKMPAIA